jgi:hypothetical protein
MDYVGSTLVHVGDLGSTSWRGGEGVEEAVGDIKWKAARCSAAWLHPALRVPRVWRTRWLVCARQASDCSRSACDAHDFPAGRSLSGCARV